MIKIPNSILLVGNGHSRLNSSYENDDLQDWLDFVNGLIKIAVQLFWVLQTSF